MLCPAMPLYPPSPCAIAFDASAALPSPSVFLHIYMSYWYLPRC